MKSVLVVWWAIAFALCLNISSSFAASKILDLPIEDLGSFYWTSSPEGLEDVTQIQPVIDKQDPYQIYYFLFRSLRYAYKSNDQQALSLVLTKLDYMLDEYEPAERTNGGVRWKYGHAFNEIPPQWWSGMDGFFGPLTLYAAWQVTGKQKYKDAALASARLTLRSPPEGGNLWRHPNGCWISEFAWPGITMDKEYHVVNGQLFGLHALLLLSEASGDQELKNAYSCARKGSEYQANRAKEVNKGEWPWYRTNPPTITPINYLLIETVDYASLSRLTGDKFFTDEAARRRNLFATRYPFVVTEIGGKPHLVVSFIGAPNPYESQTYGVEIVCRRGADKVRFVHQSQLIETKSFMERYTVDEELPWIPESCDYNVRRGDFTFPVFTQNTFPPIINAPQPSPTVTPSLDIIAWDGKTARLSPAFRSDKANPENSLNSEGRLDIEMPWDGTELLAMTLKPEVNQIVQFYIVDEKDQYAYRLYPAAKKGCENIVVLSKDGFSDFDKLEKTLHRVILRLDTSQAKDDYSVEVKDIALLRNPVEIRSYLAAHPQACFRSETLISEE